MVGLHTADVSALRQGGLPALVTKKPCSIRTQTQRDAHKTRVRDSQKTNLQENIELGQSASTLQRLVDVKKHLQVQTDKDDN